ncbi:MAG TPA: hypothetical protein ENN80_01445 [Candidatus Hydrogenedentes bacterium]|nr:hypothetical protein [Candidatus Hydrogenedentota bacterium]
MSRSAHGGKDCEWDVCLAERPERRTGRVLYCGLGHPDDFKQLQFRRLLTNAFFWAMGSPVPAE